MDSKFELSCLQAIRRKENLFCKNVLKIYQVQLNKQIIWIFTTYYLKLQ